MTRSLRVLALEPWLGGSHQAFLEGWRARSRHRVEVLGLPARHWKWRMEGSCVPLARALAEREPADALLVSDYVDLARLRGLAPAAWRSVPALAYFHENQLTYPLSPGQERDLTHGFTNVLTACAAEGLAFNSAHHREDFARAARGLLRVLPRPTPAAELERALAAAQVVPPGIECGTLPRGPGGAGPLRVVFNQRWEHDKDPLALFEMLHEVRAAGASLELVLLGPRAGTLPGELAAARARLADSVVHDGCVEDRADYARWLGGSDVVLSAARHEFYGIAVLEALHCGARPLLPERLAYPELLPRELHAEALYADPRDAVQRLVRLAADPAPCRAAEQRSRWRAVAALQDAARTASLLDDQLEGLPRASPPRGL